MSVFTPSCQANPDITRLLPSQGCVSLRLQYNVQFSASGSGVEVCAKPTTSPRLFLSGKPAEPLGPPFVPTSLMTPSRHRKGCSFWSPSKFAAPVTHPRLLIP